jgi:hypothetical protein
VRLKGKKMIQRIHDTQTIASTRVKKDRNGGASNMLLGRKRLTCLVLVALECGTGKVGRPRLAPLWSLSLLSRYLGNAQADRLMC